MRFDSRKIGFHIDHKTERTSPAYLCQLLAIRWNAVHQAPLSVRFSRQEYWSGLPFLPPGDLPNPGIESETPASLALASKFFTTEPPGFPKLIILPYNSKGFPDFLHMAHEKNDLCIHMLLLLSRV